MSLFLLIIHPLMLTLNLNSTDLRLVVDPNELGFHDTSELVEHPLPWIGQERAESAAFFGLGMNQADYNLFVLGAVGSGRSSLLKQAMDKVAARRMTPPDLCYLHNFETPEHPRALRLPAGDGRTFMQGMDGMTKTLLRAIPHQLDGAEFKVESERITKAYTTEESRIFAELETFAEARNFTLRRESGQMLFTLLAKKGRAMTEAELVALPKERRAEIAEAERELLAEINRYFEKIRPMEEMMNEGLATLRRQVVKPLVDREVEKIRTSFAQHNGSDRLDAYLQQVSEDLLNHLELFKGTGADDEERQDALTRLLGRYRVNLIVDNHDLHGAPVLIENNPLFRSLFGKIEYQSENDTLVTDYSRIHAGSLHKAHGGFLMLHLRDLLADGLVWEKLRRFLRSGLVQIEEPGTTFAPIAAVSLQPEAVDVDVKIVLIGSRQQYYELQEGDPEFARRFRVKVDFAETFPANDETRRLSAVFIAHTCQQLGLPHFSAAAVSRLLEQSHRQTGDRMRQSALFGHTEALIVESAALSQARSDTTVEAADVDAALAARTWRHDYPEQRMRESIVQGDVLIALHGEQVGQLNGLTVVDLGDHCFGFPMRVSARTYAGEDGLVNIEREVEMSGPIHDKGVFILQHYLAALFTRNAPLALNASIVFEQEYSGIEGDSASCAELYTLLSSLSGLPLRQGIAVTGALNQYGEMLPVGGVNEKIEGYFGLCAAAGLDGSQGVLIPHRNRRRLMLEHRVLEAVDQGLFQVHTAEHVIEGLELLTGVPAGCVNGSGLYPQDSVLGRAQKTLAVYRRACQASERGRALDRG